MWVTLFTHLPVYFVKTICISGALLTHQKVLQGSILGPPILLPWPPISQNNTNAYRNYADDTQMYVKLLFLITQNYYFMKSSLHTSPSSQLQSTYIAYFLLLQSIQPIHFHRYTWNRHDLLTMNYVVVGTKFVKITCWQHKTIPLQSLLKTVAVSNTLFC